MITERPNFSPLRVRRDGVARELLTALEYRVRLRGRLSRRTEFPDGTPCLIVYSHTNPRAFQRVYAAVHYKDEVTLRCFGDLHEPASLPRTLRFLIAKSDCMPTAFIDGGTISSLNQLWRHYS